MKWLPKRLRILKWHAEPDAQAAERELASAQQDVEQRRNAVQQVLRRAHAAAAGVEGQIQANHFGEHIRWALQGKEPQ